MIYGTSHALDYWILKFNFDEKIWTCKVNFPLTYPPWTMSMEGPSFAA